MTSPTAGGKEDVLDATAAQLQKVIDRLEAYHTLPRKPAEGSFWHRLQEAISDAYLAWAGEHGSREGRAIIMAGSPGAGKSQAVATVRKVLGPQHSAELGVDESGYTTIDADDIKQLLLGNPVDGLDVDPSLLAQARAHWDGLIASQAPGHLADGRPVVRGELATLVHRLSTDTADLVRGDLLAERFDVKIEGTLQWMESPTVGQGPRLVRELEAVRYARVTVVAVDAPEHMCLKGARDRWTGPRSQGDPTARYTPPRAVTDTFTVGSDGSKTCRCIENARATHRLAASSTTLTAADLLVTHRAERGPVLIDHIGHDGKVTSYSVSRAVRADTPADTGVPGVNKTSSPTTAHTPRTPLTRQDVLRNINARAQQAPRHPKPLRHGHGIGR
ncbi:hypothetical protein [Actinomyces ruminis]|uniref:UDP-N-acetylglucosamine kinase n=1 Tax=Actinomyces ruminis TaxID=1937003 RepID=A0ABX4M8Q6_9ACTO|nr:hypothetical protein [Actinomyces ruminis]PHP51833.1 hypothetical protein BW737_014295 [Actinomyces ruminis]